MTLCLLVIILLAGEIFRMGKKGVKAGCDEEITAPGTELTSPQYPKPYSGGLDCTQVVRFNKDQKITLTFLHFNLAYRFRRGPPSKTSDMLKIHDGEDEVDPLIGRALLGALIPNPVQSLSLIHI